MRNSSILLIAIFIPIYSYSLDIEKAIEMDIPIYFEGQYIGLKPVHILDDKFYLQSKHYIDLFEQNIKDNYLSLLEGVFTGEYIRIDIITFITNNRIKIVFDQEASLINIKIDSKIKKKKDITLGPNFKLNKDNLINPADKSGFLNFRFGQNYIHKSRGMNEGFSGTILSLDSAINFKGFVLEGVSDYQSSQSDQKWRRGNVRLVKDDPKNMVRYSFGDLIYDTVSFQNYQRIAGFSYARNFTLNPYETTEPRGETSFFLKNDSNVDIIINNRIVRTLRLQSGEYDISDFPVSNGANFVKLIITDPTGYREEKIISVFSDNKLLKKGFSQYTYNIGFLSDEVSREIKYRGELATSMYYNKGITNNVTGGINFQATRDAQLLGFNGFLLNKYGSFLSEIAFSHNNVENKISLASEFQYRFFDSGKRAFDFLINYQNADFDPIGSNLTQRNLYDFSYSLRYNQLLYGGFNMAANGRYQQGNKGIEDNYSYSISLDKSLGKGLLFDLNFNKQKLDDYNIFVGITWSPDSKRQRLATSYDSNNNSFRSSWNYTPLDQVGNIWANIDVERNDNSTSIDLDTEYSGNRYSLGFANDAAMILGQNEDNKDIRSRISFNSAINFVDDKLSFSRVINDSFVIVDNHQNIKNFEIGINPKLDRDGDFYNDFVSDSFGNSVLHNLKSYEYRNINIDTRNAPFDYAFNSTNYTFLPSYKSGSYLQIGNDKNKYIKAIVLDEKSQIISLKTGEIIDANNGEVLERFFTNRKGEFEVHNLYPGKFIIQMYSKNFAKLRFHIEDDNKNLVDLKNVIIPAADSRVIIEDE